MGYVNLGPDRRPLGRLGGWLQGRLSFQSPKEYPVRLPLFIGTWFQLLIAFGPRWVPFVSLFVRWPKTGAPRWASVRVGWRYDKYAGDTIRCADNWSRWDSFDQFCARCRIGRPWVCLAPAPQPNRARIGAYIADVICKGWFDRIVHY